MLQKGYDYLRKQNISRYFTGTRETQTLRPLSPRPIEEIEQFECEDIELEQADKKIASRAMYFSLTILIATIFFQYKSLRMSTVEAAVMSAATTIAQLGWFLVPLLYGVLFAAFTVFIVYKDSRLPGEDPPTPFSPSHSQGFTNRWGKRFHMNYIVAPLAGLVMFAHMLYSRM